MDTLDSVLRVIRRKTSNIFRRRRRTTRKARSAPKGSRRIAAWIHTVVNPILEGLETELAFLKAENWTWRYYSQDLEFMHEIKRYVEPSSWPNYEQLIRTYPPVRDWFREHDRLLLHLRNACVHAHQSVTSLPKFAAEVESRLMEYQQSQKKEPYPGGATPKERFKDVVAQHIINNIKDIPEFYTTSLFWALFRDTFAYHFGDEEPFGNLLVDGMRLEKEDRALKNNLDDLRFEWGEEYDIPFTPADTTLE